MPFFRKQKFNIRNPPSPLPKGLHHFFQNPPSPLKKGLHPTLWSLPSGKRQIDLSFKSPVPFEKGAPPLPVVPPLREGTN